MGKIILIDSHVHLYPNYDMFDAFQYGFQNMKNAARKLFGSNNADNFIYIWLLAERADCRFFNNALNDSSLRNNDGIRIEPASDGNTLVVTVSGQKTFYIVAGRQIVTKERLEVLSLASNLNFEDGQRTADDLIMHIIDGGGIPVLNWAPGKWFFHRGKIVQQILEGRSSAHLFIGDTPLRNTLWPEPHLMKEATRRGIRILAGSDPLPFDGEEKYIGSYGFHLTGEFDSDKPGDSIRTLLRDPETRASFFGKRNNLFAFFLRQSRIMTAKNR